MDLLVGSVRRLSESRKKSRSLPLSAKGFPPGFTLASFEDDGSSSYSEQTPKAAKVKRKRRASCLPLPSSSLRSSSDEGEIGGEGGTSNSDTSCSSVEFLRVPTARKSGTPKDRFDEIWRDRPGGQNYLGSPRQSESVPGKLDFENGSCDSLSRKERLEALKARIAAERERIKDSSDDERENRALPQPQPKLSIWRFHSDEALNRAPRGNGNKSRAARTERYLKRKSQEDVSLKHVTHSDPNLDFLAHHVPSAPPPPLKTLEVEVASQEPAVALIPTVLQQEPTTKPSASLSWKESHAYEDPKRASDSSAYQSTLESSKDIFNLPKNPSSKMNHPQYSQNVHGQSFLPSRKPSPLTVKTVFGGPFSVAHPSPCDSGLSSQSMTSSPSIGRAPTPPPRIGKSGVVDTSGQSHPPSRPQRPVSCALPSEHLYGRIISRSPTLTLQSECSSSGRSSPWWHRVPGTPSSNVSKPPLSPIKSPPGKTPLYYYTDVPPPSKAGQMYSYTDQAPSSYRGSDTSTSAYMSDSQIDSKKQARFSTVFQRTPVNSPPPPTSPKESSESARPTSLISYSGLKSPPITNGRPLSMVLEKSESLESSINNGVAKLRDNAKTPPPTPPRKITPNRESTPKPPFDMSSEEKEKRRRTSANFEDALQELEEIYQSLGLNDEDLLDRAERRDLPTSHQLKRFSIADPSALGINGAYPLSKSSSDSFSFGPRPWMNGNFQKTPPIRRSAIPDKVNDDLAIRRLQRTVSSPTPSKSPGGPGTETNLSYLQCSPALTPTVRMNGFFHENTSKKDEPDVNYDDVSYRMYSQADSTKVPPPHPPFGIPLEPIAKCSASDYLHATPSDDEKRRVNFYKPEANPDVIRDDMAFRNLRRESKSSGSAPSSPLDAACQEVESWRKPPTRKKDRAVKSLSANYESTFDAITNAAETDKTQSMSDLIAALELESRKWEAFVNETEVPGKTAPTHGSSTETLTEVTRKDPPKAIVPFPEPVKGKHGAIYSLMCLSDIKNRKKDSAKTKSPPPAPPKRTSNIVLTKRPPHPKGFWSDSETKSFSSGFGEGSLDDLLSSLTSTNNRDTLGEVKVSDFATPKFETVPQTHAFNLQPMINNSFSASSVPDNVTIPLQPNSTSAQDRQPVLPNFDCAMTEATQRPTLNSYGASGRLASTPKINDSSTTNRFGNSSVSTDSSSSKKISASDMLSAATLVNPERVAKYKEERRKLHQARFSETAIKFEPGGGGGGEGGGLGTESPFLRRSLRLSKRANNQDGSSDGVSAAVNNTSSQDVASASSAESAFQSSANSSASSRRRFITRDTSESSDAGTLGLVRSTRASRLRAQKACSALTNGQVKPGGNDTISKPAEQPSFRKILSDCEPPTTQKTTQLNDFNDNITAKNIAASSKHGDEICSDAASEMSSSLGKAGKDKSAKRKSNLNRANVLDEPRPIPSEAHEAARRNRRVRRTSDSSQTSGSSDRIHENPFVRSSSLRVSDSTKTNITERLSLLTSAHPTPFSRKSSSTDSQPESKSHPKKKESEDRSRSGGGHHKAEEGFRRKPWALKKPDIPEVLKQRSSPVPSAVPHQPDHKPQSSSHLATASFHNSSSKLSSDSPSNEELFKTPPENLSRGGTVSPIPIKEDAKFTPLTSSSVLKEEREEPGAVTAKLTIAATDVKNPILKRRSIDDDVQGILKGLRSPPPPSIESKEEQGQVLDKHPSILKKRGSSEEKDPSDAVHPILKKHSVEENGSPVHSILKNRSSIEELSSEPKPILKKRFSQEEIFEPVLRSEPKPILKKKQGEEDSFEERPKPILKSRRSLDETGSVDLLGFTRSKFDLGSNDPAIKSILKKSFDTEDSDDTAQRPSILKGATKTGGFVATSLFASSTRVTNRRNSEDAIVSDSCLVSLNRPSAPEISRRGSVDADSPSSANRAPSSFRQSPVSFQPLPSILKRKTTDLDFAKLNAPQSSSTVPTDQSDTTKEAPRRGLKVSEGFSSGHVLRERFNRRNVPRYRTQPVTQVEVDETDNLESVQAFRALIMKKASLNIFEQAPAETKVTPVATRPLAPEVQSSKPEYPKPYRSERRRKFEKRADRRNNTRYRTLPITVEELAEAEKAEADRTTEESEESSAVDGVQTSSSDELVKLSVAAKASLFQQKAEEVKASAEVRRLSGGESNARNRFLVRRSLTRSQTQPVTEEEVHEAVKIIKDEKNTPQAQENEKATSPTEEPSRLSLVEKMKLFTQKSIAEQTPERPELIRGPSIRRSRGSNSRFRTQPITSEEVNKAKSGGLAASILKSAKLMASKDDVSAIAAIEDEDSHSRGVSKSSTLAAVASSKSCPKQNGTSAPAGTPRKAEVVIERQEAKMDSSDESSSEEEETESEEECPDKTENSKDNKTVLTGGQSHIVINQMTGISASPTLPKKIANPAIQRRLNASLRHKDESRRSLQNHSKEDSSETSSENSGSSKPRNEREKMLPPQRSLTQPSLMAAEDKDSSKKGTIADRLAALQRSGTEDWQKRILKTKPDDIKIDDVKASPVTIEKSKSISALKSKLEESSIQWKQRVEEKDAVKFTVAGKMGHPLPSVQSPGNGIANTPGSRGHTPHTTPILDRKKKIPTPVAFSSSKAKCMSNAIKVLPMGISPLSKSKSMPEALKDLSSTDTSSSEDELDASTLKSSRVLVPKADNETFSSFFESRLVQRIDNEQVDITEEVFKEMSSQSHQLLVQKRTVKKARRHAATSRNPIKALASRTDLQEEYTEVKTGVAEKEVKRMQIEQLSKSSNKCLSALAGLASTEDFKSVALRKGAIQASPLLPHSNVMLIQVKGRRHVQTRLVEAVPSSVNTGDSYVLVTPNRVICYLGQFTNVIESSKVKEVAGVIQQKKDLCFKGTNDVELIDNEKTPCKEKSKEFFKLLGDESVEALEAGQPHEDEIYETEIIATNKVYTLKDEALVPHDQAWGSLPKIEILDSHEIVVFDFGSEFYVWNGKLAPFEKRKTVAKLAKELYDNGYDYDECDINPLCPRMECDQFKPTLPKKSSSRPSWAVFAKINQHMEPVLFREKFLDWPDLTRIIKVKGQDGVEENNKTDAIAELKAFDASEMLNWTMLEPDLFLEGSHLGRGLEYYHEEERRLYEIATTSLDMWHILEYDRVPLVSESHGQFHCGDTYVVRWNYTLMQIGRDFQGNVSRHSFTGRNRCAYFFWQGKDSKITEKGASALMTVELDEERGPQVRVVQGKESPCFLNLFEGRVIVYRGERENENTNTPGPWKLFLVRGEFPSEAMLVEVKKGCQSLRSRTSVVLINIETGVIFIWHGSKCQSEIKEVAEKAVDNILERKPEEMLFSRSLEKFTIKLIEEGKETKEFWAAIGGKKRRNYFSLAKSILPYNYTPRLFHMTSVHGVFEATELFCSYGTTKHPCSYPFLQSDVYGLSQPALFLLDNSSEVFLWQGWWLEGNDETVNVATGSANHRFNIDRRCAMETTLNYCRAKNEVNPPKAYMIHAGREPLVFTNLFPEWEVNNEVVRLNANKESIEDQSHPCLVEDVLRKLDRKYYKLEELQEQPLPEGVNPSNLEMYLDDKDFLNAFHMSKDRFCELAEWKQKELKKKALLF